MDIVYFSSIPWDFLRQRPQHLVSRLAATHRILFIDPPRSPLLLPARVFLSWRSSLREMAPNLYRCSPPPTLPLKNVSMMCNRLSYRLVRRAVHRHLDHLGFTEPLLWINQPQGVVLIGQFNERLVCYDCMDDHESFSGFIRRRHVRRMESDLFERADVVFTLSQALYHKARAVAAHDRVFLVRDGGDPAHFTPEAPPDPALAHLSHPLIGFVGALYEWVDAGLIAHLASQRPDWTIVLIGPVRNRKVRDRLAALPNVHLIGVQPYAALPGLIRHFDVCFLPFLRNRHIECSDPIVLYDYLACGKPVVATDFPAARSFGDAVITARDNDAFLQAVEHALDLPFSFDHVRARRQRVMEHAWDQRTATIQQIFASIPDRRPRERLVHLVVGPSIGGVEQHVMALLGNLKFPASPALICGDGPLAERMRAAGVRTRCARIRHAGDLAGLMRLIRILRQERPSLLHTHDRRGNLFGWLAAPWGCACKRIASVHRPLSINRTDARRYLIDRLMLGSADHVIAVSQAVATDITHRLGLREDHVSVVYPGVDLERFCHKTDSEEARRTLLHRWGIPSSSRLIGLIGRLEPEKGQADFLRLMLGLLRKTDRITLLMIGEGTQRAALEQYIEDHDLVPYVRLLGFQADMPRILSALDLVVAPSRWEGFGLAVVEAMAMAKPVIAHAVGGLPEIITDGWDGLLIPPHDGDRWLEAISSMLQDDPQCMAFGQRARTTVEHRFSATQMVARIQAIYDMVSDV
jgi:glycosyltransferase involved in cell wall biosynthesis